VDAAVEVVVRIVVGIGTPRHEHAVSNRVGSRTEAGCEDGQGGASSWAVAILDVFDAPPGLAGVKVVNVVLETSVIVLTA
jgi:hypothetical protein